jgi:hypothetical protein
MLIIPALTLFYATSVNPKPFIDYIQEQKKIDEYPLNEIIKRLKEGMLNKKNKNGHTPLDLAIITKNYDIVAYY